MSKSLGAQGGAVLASPEIVAHLIDTARTFIFDTGLAPPSAGAALRALRLLAENPQWPQSVRRRAAQLAEGLGVPASGAAIVALPVADPAVAVAAAERCGDQGVRVGCFRPPSVPDANSRLRLTARADLTDADIARAVEVVRSALAVVA
jgi:8-amino-7-oxononanoate synthase